MQSSNHPTKSSWVKATLRGVPRDWTTLVLDDLIAAEAPICYGILKPGSNVDGGIPVVKVKDLSNGTISEEKLLHTSVAIDAQYSRSRLKAGDILLSIRGSVGAVAVVPPSLDGANITQDTARIRPADSDLASYIVQTLQTELLQTQIAQHTVGQAVKGINIRQLRRLEIPIPSVEEQRKIVAILRAWDAATDMLRRLVDEKLTRKSRLAHVLLSGKLRAAGNATDRANHRGAKWEFPKTSQLFKGVSRKNHGHEPVLSVTQDQGVVRRDKLDRKINMAEANTDSYKLVEPGDFIISLRSFQGGLEYSPYRGLVSPAYHVIRPKAGVAAGFYRHYFKSSDFIKRLAVAVIGIRDGKQVSYDDFVFMRIPYPPIEEQRGIAETLDALDREIDLLDRQADAIARQKRGLMEKLLTGQIRVKG